MKNLKERRIDAITTYFYPVTAGIQTGCLEIYSDMSKKGWDITVHTSKSTLDKENVLPDYKKFKQIKIKRYNKHGNSFRPELEWEKLDILVLHNFNIFPHVFILFKVLILKIRGKKNFVFIITPHSGFNPNWKDFSGLNFILKFLYHYTLGKLLINLTADGVRAISIWEYKELINKGIKKSMVRIVSNGIQKEAFSKNHPANKSFKEKIIKMKPYIVQLGRIHPIKNYEVSIKAMKEVPQGVKFVIVGPDQNTIYKQKLQKIISNLGLEKRVIFLGEVSESEKYFTLQNAELMVHLSRHEGFCNAVLEGMSQGLICIVANKTALPYLVKDKVNGYCLDPDNYTILAKKINFVLINKNSRKILKIKKRNVDFAIGRTWENVAKEIENFYRSVRNKQVTGKLS